MEICSAVSRAVEKLRYNSFHQIDAFFDVESKASHDKRE